MLLLGVSRRGVDILGDSLDLIQNNFFELCRIGYLVFAIYVEFFESIGHKLEIECLLSFKDLLENILLSLLAISFEERIRLIHRFLGR